MWGRVDKTTRDFLEESARLFNERNSGDSVENDYAPCVLPLANAVVNEFALTVLKLLKQGGLTRSLSLESNLGSIAWLLKELASSKRDSGIERARRLLLSRGIDLPHLVQEVETVNELRDVRNKAAHGKRVDREMAAVLQGKWFHKGLLKAVLLCLRPEGRKR